MTNGQILGDVKHLRDDNNSKKNTIIKLLTENISDITKSFSSKPNQEKPFVSPKIHAKNIKQIVATDYYLKSGEAKLKCILGASPHGNKFCVEPTLEKIIPK